MGLRREAEKQCRKCGRLATITKILAYIQQEEVTKFGDALAVALWENKQSSQGQYRLFRLNNCMTKLPSSTP